MATCKRCGTEVSFISSLFTFNSKKGRCKNCETAVQQALIRFREAFLRLSEEDIFTPEKLQTLSMMAVNDRVDLKEALQFIRTDALNLLDRTLNAIISQEQLNDQTESYIYQLQEMLEVPDTAARHILRRLSIQNIYRGKLPIIPKWRQQDIRLESDEVCYMITPAEYHKATTSSTKLVPGRLIATNKKLLFLSATGGTEMGWNSFMSIKRQLSPVNKRIEGIEREMLVTVAGIYLELNKKDGNGFYCVPDPEIVEAIIDTLVRIAKRQIVKAENSRHISQEVRIAVWQRDQGRCVQCGATEYLEFDHIIPRSKGGASTVNNVQLLCRHCNQAKSDRI
jgi:HNH endonuclease